MTLVYDYDIPAGLLDIVTELGVVLEGVYRNDGLVVVVERVLVSRNLRTDLVHAIAVQTDKGNREAVPHLFLELCKD